jgi:hypothetical protein
MDQDDPRVGWVPAILLNERPQGLVQAADPNRKSPGPVDRLLRERRRGERQEIRGERWNPRLIRGGRGVCPEEGDDRKGRPVDGGHRAVEKGKLRGRPLDRRGMGALAQAIKPG